MHVIKIKSLFIYPVKSLGGISLHEAQVLQKGLQYDRRWMLVDKDNRFLTQREYPSLALFRMAWKDGILSVSHQQDEIAIPVHAEGDLMRATVWNDEVQVKEVSRAHTEWFSEKLGMHCRLVFFPESNERLVDPLFAPHQHWVSLADGYPVLLISQASLDDLNSRLSDPVSMNRFRPNIVVSGAEAFDEDHWRHFEINGIPFSGVKPCARCVMTTIDQESGVKGTEPLATLNKYRKHNNKVLFGQNVLPMDDGVIRVGDVVHIQSRE